MAHLAVAYSTGPAHEEGRSRNVCVDDSWFQNNGLIFLVCTLYLFVSRSAATAQAAEPYSVDVAKFQQVLFAQAQTRRMERWLVEKLAE